MARLRVYPPVQASDYRLPPNWSDRLRSATGMSFARENIEAVERCVRDGLTRGERAKNEARFGPTKELLEDVTTKLQKLISCLASLQDDKANGFAVARYIEDALFLGAERIYKQDIDPYPLDLKVFAKHAELLMRGAQRGLVLLERDVEALPQVRDDDPWIEHTIHDLAMEFLHAGGEVWSANKRGRRISGSFSEYLKLVHGELRLGITYAQFRDRAREVITATGKADRIRLKLLGPPHRE